MDPSRHGDPPEPPRPVSPSSETPSLSPSQAKTLSNDATEEIAAPAGDLSPGQLLGSRYRINRRLGRGGMGEVWLAYDLKLQVDVALKTIQSERFPGERGLELLRREVRAARGVISPNVCRIFDLVVEEGREFVSMEYIDGTTLLELLRERGPLDLREAMRLASQFLAGLEAIHAAGLVHRDVKPENIMITRTGRVVLMDFGLAKGIAEDHRGTVAGTPAYMAPEQMWGSVPDARADIFSAGVVLAEMIAPEGIQKRDSREKIWQAVRQAPVKLAESPWRRVLERAVASEAAQRYGTVRELARALEEVMLRVEGVEEKHPYPGLLSFTAAEAEFFFGREVEVEAVWKKLQRANLLALIGPSGAGKTSFLQAGLLPASQEGWRHVLVRPGSSPFVAAAQALAPELAGDPEAVRALFEMERPERALAAVGRWRTRHEHVLLVVDQFEELFTLCRPEVQAAFADLLGRMAMESDVHVLLSMRDDFLFRCHEHAGLAPIFSELTPLGPPTGSALRRALIQPALLCGYRFEDELLADEMLAAIEGERGALPMLAFTASRLWEQRDRERGVLTREAYERIGGVSGALAQHAEVTLERIGSERLPLVRELFRNLVTAQGTRAVVEVEELLSVFGDRRPADEALRALVDARLLTSFELDTGREGEHERRIEIVHESLLARWPRLVRWQTQDADSAQLRDQLRQQSRLWEERGRPDDLLWAGNSYREFVLWRERYPGGLTAGEEAFGKAMVARAERQRRRRRVAVGATIALLSIIIVVIGVFARGEQVARRKAEASKLLALGRSELDEDPSEALAYAIASLDLADNASNRQFAIEALSRGPAAVVAKLPADASSPVFLDFSPDGKWLAVGGSFGVLLYPRDASLPVTLSKAGAATVEMQRPQFAPDGDRVVFTSNDDPKTIRIWSLSQRHEVRAFPMEGVTMPLVRGGRLFLITDLGGPEGGIGRVTYPGRAQEHTGKWTRTLVRMWEFDDAPPKLVGRWNPGGISDLDIDRDGRWVAYPKERGVYLCPLEGLSSGRDQLVGEHAREAGRVRFDPAGERLASSDASGEIRLWSLSGRAGTPLRVIAGKDPLCGLWFSPSGRVLAAAYASPDKDVRLWDLDGPRDADPVVLHRRTSSLFPAVAFDPSGRWIAVSYHNDVALWPMGDHHPFVLHGAGAFGCRYVAFSRDGKALVAALYEGGIRIWSLTGEPPRDLWKPQTGLECAAVDPLGRFVLAGTRDGAYLVTLANGRARRLPGSPPGGFVGTVAVSLDGRWAAGTVEESTLVPEIRIWDLDADTSRTLENSAGYYGASFTGNGHLTAVQLSSGGIRQWDLAVGGSVLLSRGLEGNSFGWVTRDGRIAFVSHATGGIANPAAGRYELRRYDLVRGTSRTVTTHGSGIVEGAFDSTGAILATADYGGVTRVGSAGGEEPHLLLAPAKFVPGWLDVSPDGRWIATPDNMSPTVYLWRRPEGVPLQMLPHDELLKRLRAFSSLQVAPNRESPTGFSLEGTPNAGWEKVPTW
ncbi:MAG: protein kinase domain-containing protein [Gemmatimonadota bacterium]